MHFMLVCFYVCKFSVCMCLSIYPFDCFVCVFLCLLCLFVRLFVHVLVYLSVCLFVCQVNRLVFRLSVCLCLLSLSTKDLYN